MIISSRRRFWSKKCVAVCRFGDVGAVVSVKKGKKEAMVNKETVCRKE